MQGDKNGRTFLKIAKVSHMFGLLFPTVEIIFLILTKNELGCILGSFFSQTHLVILLARDKTGLAPLTNDGGKNSGRCS
jgi:hypothetical protein